MHRNYSTSTSLNTNNEENIKRYQEKIKQNDDVNDYNYKRLKNYIAQRNSSSEPQSQSKAQSELKQERIQLSYTPLKLKNYIITKESHGFVDGNKFDCKIKINQPIIPQGNYYNKQLNTFANTHEEKTDNYYLNVSID